MPIEGIHIESKDVLTNTRRRGYVDSKVPMII